MSAPPWPELEALFHVVSAPPWPELEALFHEALARESAERAAFLAERCAGRPDLRVEVEALLRAHERTASALEVPLTLQTHLTAGMRLGSYEVLSQLGAGSMGEVYRARDTRLGRDVAIKVLPALFLSDPERRARFEREARVLASLNHPHIAAIYGVEEAGVALALVLELVEGPTLADRVAHGPLQLEQALSLAQQIAEALEAAHEKGIVHRDLKPANIKITPAGVVKVLDFGLAKLAGPGEAGPYAGDSTTSKSPTITVGGTREGVILGSAAYMSPEQARGQVVDKRADIWAFGCVLHEMLTGRQAFPGETLSDTIAAVLEREPDWRALPEKIPVTVQRLLHHCLEKDPRRRLHDIADARIELERPSPVEGVTSKTRERLPWSLAAVSTMVLVVTIVVGTLLYSRRPTTDTGAYRSSILPPPGVTLTTPLAPNARFALSPDGRRLAFAGVDAGGVPRLWVQTLDRGSAEPLSGTEGAAMPFWSPDSRFIGFSDGDEIKRIDATGGPPLRLTDNPISTGGAAWSRDGVVLLAAFAAGSPLRRVPVSGGAPSPATTLDVGNGETRHAFPFFLPDGRHFLYLAVGSKTAGPNSPNGIYVTALDSKERKLLVPGGSNAIYSQGHLFFLREQTLMAQPFDVERLELTTDAVPIAEHVTIGGATGMAGGFTASETGLLAYETGPSEVGVQGNVLTQPTWFDRSGKRIGVLGELAGNFALELAPDGTRAAVSVFDPARRARDIWLFDIARARKTRFTFDPGDVQSIWSPDGNRVVFNAGRKGHLDIYQKASNGVGPDEELLADGLEKYPMDWSPDGRFVLFGAVSPKSGYDLWLLPLFGDRKAFPFLQTQFSEISAQFSPDGRWMAYTSNESGNLEVYVVPFPGPGGKWQISVAGGIAPRWRRDGKELFYLTPNSRLMAAAVNGEDSAFEVGAVRPLFDTRSTALLPWVWFYDISPDGQRFLVNTRAETETAAEPITLVVNWPALLNK